MRYPDVDYIERNMRLSSRVMWYLGWFGLAFGAAGWVFSQEDGGGIWGTSPPWESLVLYWIPIGNAFSFAVLVKRYQKGVTGQRKASLGDAWLRAVHESRFVYLKQQERVIALGVIALQGRFNDEVDRLREIREEREAELKALGFIQGLKQRPELVEYLSNPRARLRALPSQHDGADKRGRAS